MPEAMRVSISIQPRMKRRTRTVHDLRDVLPRHIHRELWPLELLELLVDAGDATDLALTRTRVYALAVVRLAVLEGRRDVHAEEVAAGTRLVQDRVLDGVPRSLLVCVRRKNDSRACPRELGSDESDALEVFGVLLGGSREGCGQCQCGAMMTIECCRRTGIKVGTDGIAEQERDATSALLVESDLESLCNGLLARAVEAGEEDDEALLGTRRVALTESLDHSAARLMLVGRIQVDALNGHTRS